MATKKINFQKFTTKVCGLQKEMENAILSEMDRLNIGLISFAKNGDYAEFDIDRAFAVVDTWDEPRYYEVIGIVRLEDRLGIITDSATLGSETSNILDEAEFFPQDDELQGLIAIMETEQEIKLIEETFMPTDTLIEICDSMASIQHLAKKPITEKVNISR